MKGTQVGRGLWVLCLAASASWTSGACAAAEPVAITHGMALDSVAAVVATDLLDGASLPSGAPIFVSERTPGDTLGLLTRRMVTLFRARGHEVRLMEAAVAGATEPESAAAATSAPASALRLELQVDGSGVSYVRRIGGFPFGTKAYERLAAMRASATIVESGSGTVLWTRTSTRRSTDVVPKNQIRYAGSGSGSLNPPLPPGGGSRWLEPLIVIGVVAGLVVLFYSNRN